jgi:hypothetical protein
MGKEQVANLPRPASLSTPNLHQPAFWPICRFAGITTQLLICPDSVVRSPSPFYPYLPWRNFFAIFGMLSPPGHFWRLFPTRNLATPSIPRLPPRAHLGHPNAQIAHPIATSHPRPIVSISRPDAIPPEKCVKGGLTTVDIPAWGKVPPPYRPPGCFCGCLACQPCARVNALVWRCIFISLRGKPFCKAKQVLD